jgi:hypothetical protein
MEDHELARALGDRARAAAQEYCPERFLKRVLCLVDECIRASNRRSP